MEFSMTGKEKGDLLIEVTIWASLSVYAILYFNYWFTIFFHFLHVGQER